MGIATFCCRLRVIYLPPERSGDAYRDQDEWIKKTILNVANMGTFSSDRTIMQYAEKIWGAKPFALPNRHPSS